MICKRLQIVPACLSIMSAMVLAGTDDRQSNSATTFLSSAAKAGKEVVFSRNKGNCVSCHVIAGAEAPGNIGPPLVHIQMRFHDKKKLRAQIWDSTQINPDTSMPPFGRHKIITEQEIDMVTEYIWNL